MRLASFLPMLLLAFSIPVAAQNCQIFDLTATAVQVNPLTCQFFVSLDFEHNATSNQFMVQGNGVNYGPFPYTQVPLILGPFDADPNAPKVLEFQVRDTEFPDCQDVVELEVPACSSPTICEITNLEVLTGQCNPDGLTYKLRVNFQVQGSLNGFFELFAAGNISLGIFPLAALPLQLPAFPASGNPVDVLRVCIQDQIACCESIEFDAPDCVNTPCGIVDLTVKTGICTGDSTYKAVVDFGLIGPAASDSFALWANDQFIGNFSILQLPLAQEIKWNGGPNDVIKVCIANALFVCCKTIEYPVPDCLPLIPCGIVGLEVTADTCTSDSTFHATIKFGVNDPTAVDSFDLWLNGEFWGHYGLNQLPLQIADFPWNGLIFNHVRICTGNAPACCKEYQFLAPNCLPFKPCEVTDIFLQLGPCTSDSTYKVTLNFNATNPGNGTFILFAHNLLIDTFDLTGVPLMLELPWNGQPSDFITVCIGGSNAPAPNGCCKIKQYLVPTCLLPCSISDVSLDPGDCNPNEGTYELYLDFEVTNPGNDFFEVWANSTYLGDFPLASLPIVIPNFPSNGNAGDVIKICINDHPDCCETIEFQGLNCDTAPCNIFDVVLDPGDCDPVSNTYKLHLDFEVSDPGNDFFEVWANGTYLGDFPLASLPIVIPNFPSNGNAVDVIKICINDHPDCCETIEFQGPNCDTAPCNIFDVVLDPGDCNPNEGTYELHLDFGVNNPGNNFFEVWANSTYLGDFPLASLPIVIPNFPSNGNAVDVIKICINDHPDCCKTIEFQGPNCDTAPCNIFDVVLDPGDCNPNDGTYELHLDFGVNNPGNDFFEVWANGTYLGDFPLASLPIVIPNFPSNGNAGDVIKICINDHPDCCKTIEFQGPNCDVTPCEIYDLEVKTGDCHPADSTYVVTVDFKVENPASNTFGLWANGQFFGTYNLSQLPLQIPNFPWDGSGPNDVIKVCITNNAGSLSCCRTLEFPTPDCVHFVPCGIVGLEVTADTCTSDSTFHATLKFGVNDPTAVDSFDLWLNGEFWGHYGLNQLPLQIADFPWNGLIFNHVRVCTGNTPACCKEYQLLAPDCLPFGPCEITDISLHTGPCTSDSSYKITLNFNATNPGNGTFTVSIHNELIDTFNLSQVPLMLDVPWNGQAGDFIRVCILGSDSVPGTIGCCRIKQFQVPSCLLPCNIFDVVLDPGDCNPNEGTYKLHLDFGVNNPGNALFEVWGNGTYLGVFPLAALPIVIPNFPSNGNAGDVIKICINDQPDCCETIEFHGPACDAPCEIFELEVETGACNVADSTYVLRVNFQVQNPGSNTFGVWANGQFFGTYNLSQLPLEIPNFPWDGSGPNDVIKVCITGNGGVLTCCRTLEFHTPDCFPGGDCEVYDLHADVGDCTSDSTYKVLINFEVQNPPSANFALWANGQFFGLFNLSQLPLGIDNFPWSGGQVDFLKVCFTNSSGGQGACCAEVEFHVPDCLPGGGDCKISEVVLDPGDCIPGTTNYTLHLDFEVTNPGNDFFEVWGNGVYLGLFPLASLPIVIPNFPSNGNAVDVIKICINDHPDCCKTIEFQGLDCGGSGNCEIFDVVLDPGDCDPATNAFKLHLNFEVQNPGNDFFEVWGNGVYLGLFPLAGLPMILPNFPSNGAAIDVIKICINDHPDCCKILEFQGPNCGGGNCEIFDLSVDTGDCTSDSTYHVKIDFQVFNPPSNTFQVWANGQPIGTFNLNQLPLLIPDFPWNGGNFDGLKVCMLPNTPGTVPCCREIEFEVPDCLMGGGDCHIYDLVVLHTPCLCGQFFAVLTFEHENGGPGGFDIVGNGNNYGNFPYNTPQPIILGPFPGDGTTEYEFAVVDHNHPDLCHDDFKLGKVECMMILVHDPTGNAAKLSLSPNPTTQWLNVTALLENGAAIGQANVELYAADGRLVQTNTVANGANFQLDVSGLPSGVYRVVLLSDSGRLEGTFAKE